MNSNDDVENQVRRIFSPAIALLNRLNYTKEFTLLWLVFPATKFLDA